MTRPTLTDAQRLELAKPAEQFGRWLVSLIRSVLPHANSQEQCEGLEALLDAIPVAKALRGPTFTFECFVGHCADQATTQMMLDGDEAFVTTVVPKIKVRSGVGRPRRPYSPHSHRYSPHLPLRHSSCTRCPQPCRPSSSVTFKSLVA